MPRRFPRVRLCPEPLEDRANPVSFASADGYWAGSNVMSVAIGDLNGDDHLDIAAGTAVHGVEIRINDGTGKFNEIANVPIGAPFQVRLADLDGDGKLDILVGNSYGRQVVVSRGNGDGTFEQPVTGNYPTDSQAAAGAEYSEGLDRESVA